MGFIQIFRLITKYHENSIKPDFSHHSAIAPQNIIVDVEADLVEEFIPSELKSVLARQAVAYDTKIDKAEDEIRRLSQVNENLIRV